METPKTPRTRSSVIGDRFIPQRGSSMDFDISHFQMTKENNGSQVGCMSPSKEAYRECLATNLFGRSELESAKVLAFKNKAPAPKEGHQNELKVLYSSNSSYQKSQKSSIRRKIPSKPERTLDAPEVVDDYYLNLMDWNQNNLLAVALGSSVYVWNGSNGEVSKLLSVPDQHYVTSVSWAGSGNYLAVGTTNTQVQLWDAEAERQLRTMKGHEGRVSSMSWNRSILSSGGRDGYILNHDVRQQHHHISTFASHTNEVCGLKWSPEGNYLASGGNDNLLCIWDLESSSSSVSSTPKYRFDAHCAAVKALAWCPWTGHHDLLASGGGTADRYIRFWSMTSGTCVNSIQTDSQVCSLQWSKNLKELVSAHGFSKNQMCVWKYPSLGQMAELRDHNERIIDTAISPDGTTVASLGADEKLKFWRVFEVSDSSSSSSSLSSKNTKTTNKTGTSSSSRFSTLNIR